MSLLQRFGPILLFWLQVAIVFAYRYYAGRFEPQAVPDTSSYEQFPWDDALRAMRTLGYPALLKVSALVHPQHRWLIFAKFVWEVLAIWILWRGLEAITRTRWRSMLAASSLLYSHFFYLYGNSLAPDYVAASTAVAAVGWLLQWTDRPRVREGLGFTVATMLAYHLRPAYLFLVLYVPLVGWWINRCQGRPLYRTQRRWQVVLTVAATFGPLVGFSLLRAYVVGQFGLVAFGGANLAGVVTAFMTSDDVQRLAAPYRPLAQQILCERARIQRISPDTLADPTEELSQIERGFDVRTWQVCVPAARRLGNRSWIQVDRSLGSLAIEIIKAKPIPYLMWIPKSFLWGIRTVAADYLVNPVYAASALALAVYALPRKRPASEPGRLNVSSTLNHGRLLWSVAFLYLVMKLLLIVLCTPPFGRLADAAGLLLAVPLTWAVCQAVHTARD